jgi:hypothetical protein
MYSLLLLVGENASKFVISSEIYMINTRQSINLYLPSVNLSKCKNGPYFMGIKIFNHLPRDIRKLLYDLNKFKVVTKNFFKGIFLPLWVVWQMKSNFISVAVWVTFYIGFKQLFVPVSYTCICTFFSNCMCIMYHINVLPTDKAVVIRPLLYFILLCRHLLHPRWWSPLWITRRKINWMNEWMNISIFIGVKWNMYFTFSTLF